ncbi:MAG: VWA domain-containing protein, partial [Saprospiraceae bacterium]|nr:VWA domain-containing protein [Saprospiraceae bacterium]
TLIYLLESNRLEIANEILLTNPFLMSQHNEQALFYYYLAVAQMLDERGWPNYKQAEKSLNRASTEMQRSYMPDYGFFSDLENARGYLSVTARGLSTDEKKDFVCIVRYEFISMAINHFREALIYNPDNEIAQQNLDTLLHKLNMRGLPIPPYPYVQNQISGLAIAFDSLNIDSLHNTANLPVLDYTLLPNNYQLILSELSQYDEIILCLDLSGSMDDPVGWGPETSKFVVAQQLALFICLQMRANVFIGAISVGQQCDEESAVLNYPIASVSRQELMMQVDAIRPYGPTPLNKRLRMTKSMFSLRTNKKLVFLLSDGMDTCHEINELCNTAAMLAANGIDLSVFSFIYETLDPESRTAYSVYNCMTNPSEGKIYKITADGGLKDKIDYEPISTNILRLPTMDTSELWANNKGLFQFPIDGVIPPVEQIIDFEKEKEINNPERRN